VIGIHHDQATIADYVVIMNERIVLTTCCPLCLLSEKINRRVAWWVGVGWGEGGRGRGGGPGLAQRVVFD